MYHRPHIVELHVSGRSWWCAISRFGFRFFNCVGARVGLCRYCQEMNTRQKAKNIPCHLGIWHEDTKKK